MNKGDTYKVIKITRYLNGYGLELGDTVEFHELRLCIGVVDVVIAKTLILGVDINDFYECFVKKGTPVKHVSDGGVTYWLPA